MEKRNFKMKKILVAVVFVVILFMQGNWANAQFNVQGGLASRFGQTQANGQNQDTWIRSIGIGNFTNNVDMTHAFLHVNSNYLLLPQNNSIASLGEVFRTDCPATETPFWRMYRGGNEMARIYNPVIQGTNSNGLVIETVNTPGGWIKFNTALTTRMYISDSLGFIGIGTITPKAKLEVANGDIAVTTIGTGIILKSTNGENFYRITVNNNGELKTELVTIL